MLNLVKDMLFKIDIVATQWINSYAGTSNVMDFITIWISTLGVPLLVLATAAQWWLGSDRQHTRHVLVAAGFSFLTGLALNQILLLFIHRMRPYDAGMVHLLIAPSADYSFPSDHATASFAVAAVFLLHGMRGRGLAFLVVALIVAFSRVYVGIHYTGDVLGGALTGIMAAAAVRSAYWEDTRADRLITRIL